MNEVRIPYKPNKIVFILAIAFFAACAGFMGNIALTNDRGLILNRIIEFSPLGATNLYWAVTIAALSFVLVGTLALIKSMFSNREIVITNESISSPKSGFSKQDVTVNFSDITGVNMQTIQKTKILNIEHLGGRLSIPNSMLPNKASFEELVSQLQSRVNG
ncbi:TPA: hypothetical protein I7280_23385 [Vibrio parahaemolyticus]|nr:hypothetical protein [Vibrio parahaemolyticus]